MNDEGIWPPWFNSFIDEKARDFSLKNTVVATLDL